MFNSFSKKNAGFTVLEVIIAIFVISIGVLAVVRVMPSIISGSSLNNDRLTAAYLAQEGIEIVRNIRDSNRIQGDDDDDGFQANCKKINGGCEVDYFCVTVLNPNPGNPHAKCLQSCGSPQTLTPLKIDPNKGFNYSTGSGTQFKRVVYIEKETDYINVTSVVFWNKGSISVQET